MIGIDIVQINRLERLVARFGRKGLERFLNESEIALCLKSHRPHTLESPHILESTRISESTPLQPPPAAFTNSESMFLKSATSESIISESTQDFNIPRIAGFWAAKEACAKALGVGIGRELGFLDMYVSKDSRGAPHLTLTPQKMEAFGIEALSLSISHDGGFAIAAVMVKYRKSS